MVGQVCVLMHLTDLVAQPRLPALPAHVLQGPLRQGMARTSWAREMFSCPSLVSAPCLPSRERQLGLTHLIHSLGKEREHTPRATEASERNQTPGEAPLTTAASSSAQLSQAALKPLHLIR